jgi:hypothetical protein
MRLRRRDRPLQIRQTEVGGLPAFWTEAPAPFAVFLVFRVGRADETLATGGITHLVEHLAMPTETPHVEVNATVTPIETFFWAVGNRERAVTAMNGIATRLAERDLARLETERRILLTEAASAGMDAVRSAATLRFGAARHGLVGYDELGLHRVAADEVAAWWGERFTAGNAALYMTARPPRELSIRLPAGTRMPAPEPVPIDYLQTPALYPYGVPGGVSVAMLVERTVETTAALSVAEQRLRRRLRFELGVTYGVSASYEPLSGRKAHAVLWADCLDERAADVRDEAIALLRELAETGPTEEEQSEGTALVRQDTADPLQAVSFLHHHALQELLGEELESPADLLRQREAVTAQGAADALAAALDTMIVTVPEGTRGKARGVEPYPVTSPRAVSGRGYRLRGVHVKREYRRPRLVCGDEGVSLVTAEGPPLTVVFDECVALQRWAEGQRGLWGRDGFYLFVDPERWRGGREAVRHIDDHVPAELVVPMDRELEAQSEQAEGVLAEKVKRRWWTSDERRALAGHLLEGETVQTAAEASRGWKAGLLVATSSRLLFLYFEDIALDLPRAEIDSVSARPARLLRENKLIVSADGVEHTFSDIRPKERLDELSQALKAGY